MKIRRAQKGDAKIISELNIALAKESEGILLDQETIFKGVSALLSDEKKGIYFLAEENKMIIGQLMITVEWSDWRNKPIWWVQSVYVQKTWRRKGVFTRLLDEVIKMARQERVALLRLYAHQNNTSALQVYEKSGWHLDHYVIYHHSL